MADRKTFNMLRAAREIVRDRIDRTLNAERSEQPRVMVLNHAADMSTGETTCTCPSCRKASAVYDEDEDDSFEDLLEDYYETLNEDDDEDEDDESDDEDESDDDDDDLDAVREASLRGERHRQYGDDGLEFDDDQPTRRMQRSVTLNRDYDADDVMPITELIFENPVENRRRGKVENADDQAQPSHGGLPVPTLEFADPTRRRS